MMKNIYEYICFKRPTTVQLHLVKFCVTKLICSYILIGKIVLVLVFDICEQSLFQKRVWEYL